MFRICKHKTFACSAHPCFHGLSPVNLPSAQFLKLVIFLNNCGCGVTPYWKVLITWGSSFHIGMQLQKMLDANSQFHVFILITWLIAPVVSGCFKHHSCVANRPPSCWWFDRHMVLWLKVGPIHLLTYSWTTLNATWLFCKLCESLHRGMQTG
jgi:hypothetical protein